MPGRVMLLLTLAPYELSLLLIVLCLVLAWPRRHLVGARFLLAALGCEFAYGIGYIGEILAPTLEGKIFWDNCQWMPCMGAVLLLSLFVREYVQKKPFEPWFVLLFGTVPVAIGVLGFTNDWHGLVGTGYKLIPGWPAPALHYEFGKMTWLAFAFLFGLQVQAIVTMLIEVVLQQGVFRRQAFGILVGLMMPTAALLSALFDVKVAGYRDLGPFALTVGNAFILWSLLRYRALRLVPMARALLFEQIQTGMLLLDETLHVIDGNEAVFLQLAMGESKAIGHPADAVLTKWPSVLAALQAGRPETQTVRHGDLSVQRWLLVDLQSVKEGGQTGWLLLSRDITEQKLAQDEAARSKEAAVAANVAKTRFFTTLVHEIRTPLAAMMGLNRLLGDTTLDRHQQDLLQKLDGATRHLLELLNHTLDFSKFEAGRLSLQPVDFDLGALLSSIVGIFWPSASDKGLQFSHTVEEDVPQALFGDGLRLKQILANLLGNAVKFTSRGEVKLHVSVIKKEPPFADLAFVVTDTGIGLSADQMESLFQPFSQANETISLKYGGTGLGLSISRQLAQMLGGNLTCESQEGVGSSFRLVVRVRVRKEPIKATSDRPTVSAQSPAAPSVASPAGRLEPSGCSGPISKELGELPSDCPCVLLAEDNRTNQIVTQKLLHRIGFSSEVAANGREVLQLLDNHPPRHFAAVLMDLHMPEVDGKTAVLKLRADPRYDALPVIALTGESVPEIILDALSCGMDDVLHKPVELHTLEQSLHRHLRDKRRLSREMKTEGFSAPSEPGSRDSFEPTPRPHSVP